MKLRGEMFSHPMPYNEMLYVALYSELYSPNVDLLFVLNSTSYPEAPAVLSKPSCISSHAVAGSTAFSFVFLSSHDTKTSIDTTSINITQTKYILGKYFTFTTAHPSLPLPLIITTKKNCVKPKTVSASVGWLFFIYAEILKTRINSARP